jgi:CBS domain containing-hemolysin-like protein
MYLLISKYFFTQSIYYQLVLTVVISVFSLNLLGHEIPRAISLKYYRTLFNAFFIFYKIINLLLYPFSLLFTSIHKTILTILKYNEKFAFLTDEEKARINETDDSEALDEEEKEMIRSIFDLGDTTVDEIMVPRIDIKALPINTNLDSVLKMVREESHSRIPVFKETIDSIIGILYTKDIISWLSEHKTEDWELSKIIKKAHYVPVGKKVNDLMREFKRKHIHLAIVVDEYGGTAGVVTMEDILEEIVGDIQDEYDEEEQEIIKVSENTYLVDPHIDLYDLNEELDLNLEQKDSYYNTLSGLIYHEYGDVPLEGTLLELENVKITIVKMDNQRIAKVKIDIPASDKKVPESDSF